MQPRGPIRRGRSFGGQGTGGEPERRAVEIAAATVEDAVRLALQQLNLGDDQVEIEVLEDPDMHDVDEALVRVSPRAVGSGSTTTHPAAPATSAAPVIAAGAITRPRNEDEVAAPGNRAPREAVDLALLQATAQEITEDLMDLMGLQASVQPVDLLHVDPDEPPTVGVEITGPDLGILIGRRGDVLQQFQYIVTLLVNRRMGAFNRVIVDVGGYKRKREETLMTLAGRMADRVVESGRPLPLEAMPPNERRVIHLALKEDSRVFTESQGEGDGRKIVIYPR